MSTLTQANANWSSRPNDERFLSLLDMQSHFERVREESRQAVIANRRVELQPHDDNKGLSAVIDGKPLELTHWSFGQLATLAGAPAGYLRDIPSPLAADCVNYGLQIARNVDDVGILTQENGSNVLRAATGPRYGRIWNATITNKLVDRFGDGVTGAWKVPGEFGENVPVTKENTTLYASDRDMFIFLADEQNRIEIPNRRNGESGSLARGFFLWNSEVGSSTFGIGTFLFDYVCKNRIVWGAEEYKEVRIRHTGGAPERWLEEAAPALEAYAQGSASNVQAAIADARAARLDNVDDFLAKRYGKRLVPVLKAIHEAEEATPITSLWDVTTAVTAYARGIEHQDERVKLERDAGLVMAMAA